MFNRASDPRTKRSGPVGDIQAFVWLALLAAIVGLLGGSARFDAVQIAALRPLAALFLIPALYFLSRASIEDSKTPLVLMGLLVLWTALQLVPLPPSVWQALPGRDTIAQLDTAIGAADSWRPIAWVPMRGWNALFAMIVPVTGALLVAALRPQVRTILLVLAALGAASAIAGMLQMLSGSDSPLYLYRFTNSGSPVGLFANENHASVFAALVLVLIARAGFAHRGRGRSRILDILLAGAFLIVLMGALISGSRAGLGLTLLALVACAAMGWLWIAQPAMGTARTGLAGKIAARPQLLLIAAAVAIAGLLYALFQFDRVPGAAHAFEQSAFEDLRWKIAPILWEMMMQHWLVGTGFGSFDAVYLIYEPTQLQNDAYLNQAHNDWAQLVIEGGVPAILLLLALARWVAFGLRKLYSQSAPAVALCLFWCTIAAILAAASLFDYPLRTPIFQLAAAWLAIAFAFDLRRHAQIKASQTA